MRIFIDEAEIKLRSEPESLAILLVNVNGEKCIKVISNSKQARSFIIDQVVWLKKPNQNDLNLIYEGFSGQILETYWL